MSTLETKHDSMLKEFEQDRTDLPEKRAQLKNLEDQLACLLQRKERKALNLLGFQMIPRIQGEIERAKREIKEIEANSPEHNYLLTAGSMVMEYFDKVQQRTPHSQAPKKDIRQFFIKDTKKEMPDQKKTTFQRADLFDQYLARVDSTHVQKQLDLPDPEYCYQCHEYKYLDRTEAKLVCPTCGCFENETMDSDKPNYQKDQPQEISYFAYKRINHFNEILNQFQAKENTEIPQEVYDTIIMEMSKERRTNLAELNPKIVKDYFRKYRHREYNKYYEHIPHIINRLNGIPPKKLTPVMEENLRTLFKKVQAPFERHCPNSRTNFLSYNYTIYKFCELLGYDEFLDCFPLLKSRNKLLDQEKVWKKICEDLNFQFIPTL